MKREDNCILIDPSQLLMDLVELEAGKNQARANVRALKIGAIQGMAITIYLDTFREQRMWTYVLCRIWIDKSETSRTKNPFYEGFSESPVAYEVDAKGVLTDDRHREEIRNGIKSGLDLAEAKPKRLDNKMRKGWVEVKVSKGKERAHGDPDHITTSDAAATLSLSQERTMSERGSEETHRIVDGSSSSKGDPSAVSYPDTNPQSDHPSTQSVATESSSTSEQTTNNSAGESSLAPNAHDHSEGTASSKLKGIRVGFRSLTKRCRRPGKKVT